MQTIQTGSLESERAVPCLWMQAGVVRKKLCRTNFQCEQCPFEGALKRTSEQNEKLRAMGKSLKGRRAGIVYWKDRIKERPAAKRPCIHHMKGRIQFRVCNHAYQCVNCEFDQYFHDQYAVHAVVRPVHVLEIEGFAIPQGYYFHPGHTWAKLEEDRSVRVGIDDFALRLMGPQDRIESPLIGKQVIQGRADITMCRGENQAKLFSPVSGVVTAINPALRGKGRLANEDPFTEGWVMTVHANNLRQDLKQLMINQETQSFMEEEVDRLYGVIEEVAGPLAADGGTLGEDIYGSLPDLGWERLSRMFLRTR